MLRRKRSFLIPIRELEIGLIPCNLYPMPYTLPSTPLNGVQEEHSIYEVGQRNCSKHSFYADEHQAFPWNAAYLVYFSTHEIFLWNMFRTLTVGEFVQRRS